MAGGSKRPSGPPGTGPPPVTHRDLFHRVNFTLQASAYLQHLVPGRISDVNELGNAASGPSRRDSHSPALEVVVDRKGKRRAMEAEVDRRSKRRSDDVEAGADFGRLAREDMQSTRGMAVHNLLKLDPSLKRAVCRSCGTVLIPGLTSRIRLRPDKTHFHKSLITCLICSTRRSIPVPPPPPLTPDVALSHTLGDDPQSLDRPQPIADADSGLDGPVRRRRREKAARRGKVPFHEREAAPSDPRRAGEKKKVPKGGGVIRDGVEGGKGHSLWRGGERVEGWGVKPAPDNDEVAS